MTMLGDVPSVEEPPWMYLARTYIGIEELPGIKHNSTIIKWFEIVKSKVRDDETPWCAAYVGGIFEGFGIESTKSLAARSYLNWGIKVDRPLVGCVVVFSRPGSLWSGHVGFVVGKDALGRLLVLGGNQGNSVSIQPFTTERVLGYRMPKDHSYTVAALPVYLGRTSDPSRNEA